MRPWSGASKPAISRSKVVLPQPDGPTIAVRLPLATLEIDAGKCRHRAVMLVQAADFEKAHRPAIRFDWT